ncbi:MAG: integrase core domain-containing protein [Planctomycetota bacterium]
MEETERRKEAVRRYLAGEHAGLICEELGRSERWLYKWLQRFRNNENDWAESQSRAPNNVPHKTDSAIEKIIIDTRKKLENQKYAQVGSMAILWELKNLNLDYDLPSTRTIERILHRNNLTEASESYEPKGTDYPSVSANCAHKIQQADFVGPRYIEGDGRFYCLNLIDCCTRVVTINPSRSKKNSNVTSALLSSWKSIPAPDYLQLDNALCFRGSNRYPRSFGLVIRLCLHLGITPVFIPPQEPWRNGVIERFQGTFEKLFFRSQKFDNFDHLQSEASVFETFHNQNHRYGVCQGMTPVELEKKYPSNQNPLPGDFDLPDKLFIEPGEIHLVRFIRSDQKLDVFGIDFSMPESLMYEYVKAVIDTGSQSMTVFHDNESIQTFPFEVSQRPMKL